MCQDYIVSDSPAPPVTPISTQSVVDILVAQGLIPQEQVAQLQADAEASGKTVATLIREKNLVPHQTYEQAQAQVFNVPFVALAEKGVSPEALDAIPVGLARKYNVLPFASDTATNSLLLAMANPLDLEAIDFLNQKTGLNIVPYYADPHEINTHIEESYAQNITKEVGRALADDSRVTAKKKTSEDVSALSQQVIRQAPITKIVETILGFAVKSLASDVHIEPQESKIRVRYRIDGILQEKLILPKNVHEAVVSKIKIMADLKIDEKRLPQDGRFDFSADGQTVDLRVSSLPTIHGEKIVMRLLKKDSKVPTLQQLGLDGLALKWVNTAIQVPHGIILVTGPTGSGKTTTLYSVLHLINTAKVNIVTIEDPVEYEIPGVNQVQANPQAGLTFASGLRSFLRQDPDIIMVGEIRDEETVELAIQASLTGHLVFSTLHTSSAAGAIPRMLDMGAETFLLASTVAMIMGQRIVRRINPDYKEEYRPEPAVIEDMKQVLGPYFDNWCQKNQKSPEQITLFRPKAERPADEPEYKGRVGIFEVMRITNQINTLILERKPAHEIEQLAIKDGMLLMKQDGYLKVLDGQTTIEEVLRVAEI